MRAFFEDSKALCPKSVLHSDGMLLLLLLLVYNGLASSTNLRVQKQQHLTPPRNSNTYSCI